MTNADKTAVNRAIDNMTHVNDVTIKNLKIYKDILLTMIDAAVGKAVKESVKKIQELNATCSKSFINLKCRKLLKSLSREP